MGNWERNERNAENKDGNASNGMGMQVQGISVKMQKNVGHQGSNAGNQSENLSIAVEITQNSNRNDKFKEWREVKKIVENGHICKTKIHTFDLMPFLLSLSIFSSMSFCFHY